VTGGWITQADRSRWQQRAASELAAILAAHPDIPVLAWTVTASGGALSGQVLAPADLDWIINGRADPIGRPLSAEPEAGLAMPLEGSPTHSTPDSTRYSTWSGRRTRGQ